MDDAEKITTIEFMTMIKAFFKPLVEKGKCFIADVGPGRPRYLVIVKKRLFERQGQFNMFVKDTSTRFDRINPRRAIPQLWNETIEECWQQILAAKRNITNHYQLFRKENENHYQFSSPCTRVVLDSGFRFKKYLKASIKRGGAWFYRQKDGTLFEGEVKCNYEEWYGEE